MSQDTIASQASGAPGASLPARLAAFGYGAAVYLFFLAAFLYFIGFVAGLVVPKGVNDGPTVATGVALVTDLALIALFGIQHSVMARPAFKRVWTKLVPKPVERSTYVLFAALVLVLLMWLWKPIPGHVWVVENPAGFWALWALFALGWAVLLASTYMTDHFDLFGLRQVFLYLAGRPYTPVAFKARFLYRHMRHPLYTGFLIAFWATPDMTVGRLVLAGGLSAYIVVGTLFEERDLVKAFGDRYRAYCKDMPRYLPRLRPKRS